VRISLPAAAAARAEAVAQGREEAAPILPAATIVLLRDAAAEGAGSGRVEAYVQLRHRGLRFAGGMYAFPGGRVDAGDATFPDDLWCGPDPGRWARRFAATDDEQARAHVVAVVRELFEESGVLIATPAPGGAGTWPGEEQRHALAAGETSLPQVLGDNGLLLDAGALTGWSRWVTPRLEPRRFDAWFFLARLPDGQAPRSATEESHEGLWVSPDRAVAAAGNGDLAMLPPTWWTLRELASAASVADVLANPPAMQRYTVGWVRRSDEVVLVLPDDPDYPGTDPGEGT
jgi:8-oxo-dGTP pyrophosphatase MutT (NUDIX family)